MLSLSRVCQARSPWTAGVSNCPAPAAFQFHMGESYSARAWSSIFGESPDRWEPLTRVASKALYCKGLTRSILSHPLAGCPALVILRCSTAVQTAQKAERTNAHLERVLLASKAETTIPGKV